MRAWSKILEAVFGHVQGLEDQGCDLPFFRGHADESWNLQPSISRTSKSRKSVEDIERRLYYDFVSLAGPLLSSTDSSWHTLFAMQHHGVPTRLLDWSTSFAAALHFALRNASAGSTACVWILNPFELNGRFGCGQTILTPPDDFQESYYQNFISGETEFGNKIVSINPVRTNARQRAQESTFTLFGDLSASLNDMDEDVLFKIEIPPSVHDQARAFLKLAGVNEYSLFPDLDGVARLLKSRHWHGA